MQARTATWSSEERSCVIEGRPIGIFQSRGGFASVPAVLPASFVAGGDGPPVLGQQPPSPMESSMIHLLLVLACLLVATPASGWQVKVARPPGSFSNRAESIDVDAARNIVIGSGVTVPDGRSQLGAVKLSGVDGAEIWRTVIESGPLGDGIARFDPNGDVILGGRVSNPDPNETWDILVAKLAGNDGQVLWSTRVNGTANTYDRFGGLDVDAAGNVVITGSIRNATGPASTVLVLKLAGATGAQFWRRDLTSGDPLDDDAKDNSGYAVAFDADGDVVVTGSIDVFPFDREPLVAKLRGLDGEELWRQTDLETIGDIFVGSLAIDAAGNIVVGGDRNDAFFYAKIAGEDGNVMWSVPAGIPGTVESVAIDAAGEVYVGGEKTVDILGSFAVGGVFVVRKVAGANGAAVWTYEAPAKGPVGYAKEVVVDRDGNVVAVGATAFSKKGSLPTMQVVKLAAANGGQIYRRVYDYSEGVAVAVDAANDVVAAGLGSEIVKIAPPTAGKTLVLKDDAAKPQKKRKLKVQAKDVDFVVPALGSPGDPTFAGGTLVLRNPTSGETATLSLPAANWKGTAKGYAYKLKGDPCAVTVKQGSWQAQCSGTGLGFTLDEPSQGSLLVQLTMGTQKSCVLFGGEVKKDLPNAGKKGGVFEAKNAPLPADCL
jgi:hypothetical protein